MSPMLEKVKICLLTTSFHGHHHHQQQQQKSRNIFDVAKVDLDLLLLRIRVN